MNTETTSEQVAVQETAAAPESLFVTVPETKLPNGHIEPAFMISKYHASRGADGQLVISAMNRPLVDINFYDAVQACKDAGYSLITETQALALAVNIAGVAANWTGGAVGEGDLLQGLRFDPDDVWEPYAGDYVSADPREARVFTLSNGEQIFDAAGNLYTWVFDNVQGNEQGIVARAFSADSLSITSAPHPSMLRGVGWYPEAGADWSGLALMRGGYWCSYDRAGVFRLGRGWPDYDRGYVGVRCTKGL